MNDSYRDPSIITKGLKRQGQKCAGCYVRGSEAELKICSRCKATNLYLQEHKAVCLRNAEHAAQVAEVDASGISSILLPPGVTFVELDNRLEKWIKFHNSTLMAATIHALSLPLDLTRSKTHVLQMSVRPRTDHNGVAAKFFRIIDASVIEISAAQQYPPPWPESIEQLAALREESEGKQRGTVAAVGIECPPLGVQFVPFGSLRNLSALRILPDWKEIVIRDVERAKKFTKFGG
ncbi:hypothetical protein BDZ94DRAFT_1283392 [Collybia nuda]|uniref:MYND-type domain-containing protein n=1 Tax=Collybia nuda TaxID=64659 RepID=A0A9P6CDE4_9AGAR|nr:hypothetical protein BDZ94DRAFT_1283392 [Collybia nuda]